jgi:hypothetical protein
MLAAHIVPDDTTLHAAADLARAQGMRLYTNGERAVISPCKPTLGRWIEVRAKVVNRTLARLEALPCAA